MSFDLIAIYQFIQQNGLSGVVIVLLGVVIFLFRKLFTNHLAHIQKDIKDVLSEVCSTKDSLDKTNKKIDQIDAKQDQLGERVAKIEGRLEGPKKKAKLT